LRLAGRGSRRTWRPGGGAATDRPPAPCDALRRAVAVRVSSPLAESCSVVTAVWGLVLDPVHIISFWSRRRWSSETVKDFTLSKLWRYASQLFVWEICLGLSWGLWRLFQCK
jgi:hypothetical protein